MFKKIIFALLATPVKISLTELDSNVPVLAICLPCKHIIEKVKACSCIYSYDFCFENYFLLIEFNELDVQKRNKDIKTTLFKLAKSHPG